LFHHHCRFRPDGVVVLAIDDEGLEFFGSRRGHGEEHRSKKDAEYFFHVANITWGFARNLRGEYFVMRSALAEEGRGA